MSNSTSSSSQSSQSGTSVAQSPIDDLTYDVVTMIHAKGKALEAYQKYLRDAQGNEQVRQLFEQVQRSDQQHIAQLQQVLVTLLGSGSQGGSSGSSGSSGGSSGGSQGGSGSSGSQGGSGSSGGGSDESSGGAGGGSSGQASS